MVNADRLPDLRLIHAVEDRVRACSDVEYRSFLVTAEAEWLFVDCAPCLAADSFARLDAALAAGVTEADDAVDRFALAHAERIEPRPVS